MRTSSWRGGTNQPGAQPFKSCHRLSFRLFKSSRNTRSATMADELIKPQLASRSLGARRARRSPGVFAARFRLDARSGWLRRSPDRGLRRRLRHHRLWGLRLVHERQYDPDRLPGRRGRVWPGVGVGVGDPVLLRRLVRGRIVRGTPRAPRAAPCLTFVAATLAAIIGLTQLASYPPASDRDRQFRNGRHEQRALPRRRASREPHLRHWKR